MLILSLWVVAGFSQEIPIGDWRDHLPYSDAISVSYGDGVVYCATNSAVFTYDTKDGTIERLSLVNGLSDIDLSKIKYNDYNQKVIVAYANGNIDLIDKDKKITNISFIKTSNIVGSKIINDIFIQGKYAYLSTGFGIVVLDTDKPEITDTYLYGPLGSYLGTNAVTMDDTNIYAASDQGVFYASKNSANLADYNSWSQIPELGNGRYNGIEYFSDHLFASFDSPLWDGDTVFYNDSGIWQRFSVYNLNVNGLSATDDRLFFSTSYGTWVYDKVFALLNLFNSFNGEFNIVPSESTVDSDFNVWIADNTHGLIKTDYNSFCESVIPNGPSSRGSFAMDFNEDELWMVSGGYGIYLSQNLINHFSSGTWKDMGSTLTDAQGATTLDMVSIAINPNNSSNVYAGSWTSGLYEFNNDVVTHIYNARNSALDSTFFGTTQVGAIKFDNDNNLWVSSSYTNGILAVKTPDNNWYSFSFPGYISATEYFTDMLIDQNHYKWLISPGQNRILVFDDNNTPGNSGDDRFVLNNNIPGSQIQCITQDLDGEVWIGTNEGIGVFYNPSSVFDENIKAEQIYIQQDGQTQILLETASITAIAIDGANRKWIGTQSSGVFLMSDDGTEQIEHFTTDNSPLFSNNILDIVINQKNGEVYFGTDKGLISYKGTATEADDDFNNIFVYPNPVKPDFTGTIAIRGLVKDTDVRITDISGNIVYKTTSLGGQAIWDGTDFNGNRVQTGVYMIFNGSPEGDKKAAAKILFLH